MTEKNRIIEINHVNKHFKIDGSFVQVLRDINVSFYEGEFVTIVGASGCGKSTLLRMIAGFEKPSDGAVLLENESVQKPSIKCGMVFQESRLFPWLTVEKNIGYGLSDREEKAARKERLQKYINLVGLQGFEKALPQQLSGGMQQRASIARGLINSPNVLLLDEPFGALDAITRINMQHELLRIWQSEKKTMIMVTHDIDEAIYLGDRIIAMSSRPGTVKKVINVNMYRPRERSSAEFSAIRKEIFQEFFENAESSDTIEYYL